MDFLSTQPQFSNLSLQDLLKARNQFHAHLMHKENVVGTALGRYLIRKTDPYPSKVEDNSKNNRGIKKYPRTLENSEVREYSWPAVLVFVSKWVEETDFSNSQLNLSPSDFIPKAIYLEDGRSVPICVVYAPVVEDAPNPIDPNKLKFPDLQISGGYPVITKVQGAEHIASIGCLLTDGNKIYALTSRHVAGTPGQDLFTNLNNKPFLIGKSSYKQLGRLSFEKIYETWPGKNVYIKADVGLIEIEDQTKWNPSIYGIGQLGPLADLSIYNLSLNLIGCPVRAYGCASGIMFGRISALFYRYKSVGGFEYISDFLIGSRTDEPLPTHPGDSGSVWVIESDKVKYDRMPIAVQWGGTVFSSGSSQFPFALATNLSTVCRELDVDLFRSRSLASFDYWGAVGHYTIGSLACDQISNANLKRLMLANRRLISFDVDSISASVNDVSVPGFVQLADVPDKVWKKTNKPDSPYGRYGIENPNHYSDMDYQPSGGQSLDQLTPNAQSLDPQVWRDYYDSINWIKDSQRGLLPFRVWQIYKKMVEFVSNSKVNEFVTAAGILAHYIGDACQPLHSSYLDDGDPFRNPDGSKSNQMLPHSKGFAHGIHGIYEDTMLDANASELLEKLKNVLGVSHEMQFINSGKEAGFAAIELMRRTRNEIAPMDLVETFGQFAHPIRKAVVADTLWQQFGVSTVKVIADGCKTLAMIWESAWIEGNGDINISKAELKELRKTEVQKIYENTEFLPSAVLNDIDQHLGN